MKVGTGELLIVLAVIILLFGARKLPDLARSLGASAREFRKGVSDGEDEDEDEDDWRQGFVWVHRRTRRPA